MPAESIMILTGILFAFTLFGVILAVADFYTHNIRPRPGSETE